MSKDGGTETTETTSKPLPEQYEQLKTFWAESGRMYQNPTEQFGGQRIAGRDPLSTGARDRVGALGTEEYRENATGFLGDVLGGEFMGGPGDNPALDAKFQAMSDRIGESYNRIIRPGTAGRFGQAGRSTSMAHSRAEGQDQRNLGEALGRTSADVYYADYNNRMRDRMSALGLVPAIAGQERADIGEQRAQGMVEENYAQRQIDDIMARFNFDQAEPESRLNRFGGRVANNLGFGFNTSSTTGAGGGGTPLALGLMGLLGTLGGAAIGGPAGAMVGGTVAGGLGRA
jgi:hypothetical protein